ncbi:hypothetical protein GCM10023191_052310 [Actinoallomurus oryzae]|uniref:TfoX N-terminal domain-containing protein n=1 Tax=Actinoallomurus oryzae TaxID=502180 RepID=A0ABP8QEM8_9ACTN
MDKQGEVSVVVFRLTGVSGEDGRAAGRQERHADPAEGPKDRYADPAEEPQDRYAEPAEGPQDRYADLVEEMTAIDGVDPPSGGRGFGRTALRFHGKIFAMFVRGRLVLKLPADRVGELVSTGEGARFDANKDTPMREWLSLAPHSGRDWPALAHEALAFARANRRPD